MKLFLCAFFSLFLVFSAQAKPRTENLPNYDLEMTGREYLELQNQAQIQSDNQQVMSDELHFLLTLGKRNLQWFDAVNKARPKNPLELSNPQSQTGIPIDSPRESSPSIIHQKYLDLQAKLPAAFWDIMNAATAVPSATNGLNDDDYLNAAKKMDGLYQNASRWLLEEPYLKEYSQEMANDIRGYYFLAKEINLQTELSGWKNLPADKSQQLTDWLIGICFNSTKNKADCQNELQQEITTNSTPEKFFATYFPVGKQLFDSYFEISNPRSDVTWTQKNPDLFSILFQKPQTTEIQKWLSDNIEDEWKQGAWQLRLDFDHSNSSSPLVVFVAGATPHVNERGGSEITMDANRNIQEYSTRWTIRHEFGHVLGFPDCYIEFYDEARGVMINYQIDVDNLMCSRRGHIQAQHVEQLKKAYFR